MRRKSHNHLILMSVLFWVLLAGGFLAWLSQGSASADGQETQAEQLVAQQCIENAFPVISRGGDARETSAEPAEGSAGLSEDQGTAEGGGAGPAAREPEGQPGILKAMIDRTFPFIGGESEEPGLSANAGTQPGGETAKDETQTQEEKDGADAAGAEKELQAAAEQEKPKEVPVLDTEESKKPLVLIYHTHATESYQPVTEGNFHSIGEDGTVREVGNELTKALEAKGIPVIHDKTIHDNPSYNQSYDRSIQTAKNYLAKNPSIKIVIDLHRDAASYSGNVGKTVNVNGNKAATYSLVIGKGNANVEKLHLFANRINAEADKLYPGMAGKIIEKQYRFNQYICDQAMLLEVGNNENTIDQVKLTGKYFADIIEAYLKDSPPQ